MKRRLSFRSWR